MICMQHSAILLPKDLSQSFEQKKRGEEACGWNVNVPVHFIEVHTDKNTKWRKKWLMNEWKRKWMKRRERSKPKWKEGFFKKRKTWRNNLLACSSSARWNKSHMPHFIYRPGYKFIFSWSFSKQMLLYNVHLSVFPVQWKLNCEENMFCTHSFAFVVSKKLLGRVHLSSFSFWCVFTAQKDNKGKIP